MTEEAAKLYPEVMIYPMCETCFENVHPGQLLSWEDTFHHQYMEEHPVDTTWSESEQRDYAAHLQQQVGCRKLVFISKVIAAWATSMQNTQ